MSSRFLTALKILYRETSSALIDLVYPPRCVSCRRLLNTLFCQYCIAEIIPPNDTAPILELDDHIAVGIHRGSLRHAIHALKYENLPEIANILGYLLAQVIQQKKWHFDTLIPVPLHADRQRERGYNQAIELAQVAANYLECAILPNALYRSIATTSQVGKNFYERQQNVKDAFAVAPEYVAQLHNTHVILIDDVCTTGATLGACATALRQVGVKSIYAATVSRADMQTSASVA